MHTCFRHLFKIIVVISMIPLGWASIGSAYADCGWVWLGDESYWICEEDDTPDVTKRIVPGGLEDRIEPSAAPTRMVQTVPVADIDQDEPRKSIRKPKPRTPETRRRPRPQPQWISQRFRTSVMGAKVNGTVELRGDDVRGVAYVYPPFGGKNTYHFSGKIQGNRVVASHHSGHVFRGEIVGGRRVVGVVTTRRGSRIPLDVPIALP